MRTTLFLVAFLAAGCDPKPSSPASDVQGVPANEPVVPAPRDDPDAESRAKEEARILSLRDEFRLLPKADQVFVAMMNNKLRRRPVELLNEREAEGLSRLGTYINEVTKRDYQVALGDSQGADRLATLLKLGREDSLKMRMKFASEGRLDQLALAAAIETAARGLSKLRDSDRTLLKDRGYDPYLKNLAD